MPRAKDEFSGHEYLPIGDGAVTMIEVGILLQAVAENAEELLPDWVRRMIHWKLIGFGRGYAIMAGGRGEEGEYLMLEGVYISRPMSPEDKWLEEHTRFVSGEQFSEYRRLA